MLCRFATSLPQLLCLRALYGVAVGVSMHSSPPYLAETSPAPVRGLVFCAKEGMIVAGILKGYMVRPWAQQQVQPGAIWSCLMLLRRDSLPSPCTGALLQCCVCDVLGLTIDKGSQEQLRPPAQPVSSGQRKEGFGFSVSGQGSAQYR